jgi:hypothetical protein
LHAKEADYIFNRKPGSLPLGKVTLISVQEEEYQLRPCRKFVKRQGSSWQLASAGERLIDLMLY